MKTAMVFKKKKKRKTEKWMSNQIWGIIMLDERSQMKNKFH